MTVVVQPKSCIAGSFALRAWALCSSDGPRMPGYSVWLALNGCSSDTVSGPESSNALWRA